MTFEHGSKHRFLLLALAGLFLIAGILYLLGRSLTEPPDSGDTVLDEPVYCTMEAKMCPDGSYVGRSGPDCEFAACPGEGDSEAEASSVELKTSPLIRTE